MKHTPAPWTINKTWGTIEGPQEQEICAIHPADASGRREPRATAQANAALIAAAPELLKALQDLEGMCNMPEVRQAMMKHNQAYYHGTMRAAREAIRKAEGER